MSTPDITPTVVLVHGAFVDASSWNGVIAGLKAAGLDASHAVPATHPADVAAVIIRAVKAIK
jgi:hypothetical protein